MGLRYCIRLRLEDGTSFFGPGVERILLLVDETGSLQTAAAQMEMSYSKAWKIIRHAEQKLGFPLLERHVGGSGGGYSRLTSQGRDFVNRYTDFRQELDKAADDLFEKYFNTGEIDEKD